MDEALELGNYLPITYKNERELEYIQFLWDAFESNYKNKKYQFAFIAYHMLTMSFVYFNIWQIKQYRKTDFEKATIGYGSRDLEGLVHKDDSDDEKRWAVSPFNFSKVQERSIVRILALIGCDKSKIGCYTKLIDDRNNTAHPNGNIYFSNQGALDIKVAEIMRAVDEIQSHSKSVIEDCYRQFLQDGHDPELRDYPDTKDQIREVLIHHNYLSQKDIEICIAFNVASLVDHPRYDSICELHVALKLGYGVDDIVAELAEQDGEVAG